MSKYRYTPVEFPADFDITGNTLYYLFEEGGDHEEFYFKEHTIEHLETLIDNRLIFTREEKPWYENIPDRGVLCKNRWSGKGYCLIVSYDEEDFLVYDNDDNYYDAHLMTPLSNNKIKQFLQEDE